MTLVEAVSPFAIVGALVFFRVLGVMVFWPVFGGAAVPNPVKVLFALSLTLVLATIVPAPRMPIPEGLWQWGVAGSREFLAGSIMAMAMIFLFAGVQLAGQLIDFEMGFGIVNAIDPTTNVQVPVMGFFHFILGILIFLAIGGPHMVIQALAESFRVAPLLEPVARPEMAQYVSNIMGGLFVQGIKLSAPVIVTLLMYTAAIGIVAKTVPTMNLLIVGFPIRIGLGLFAVGAALPVFGPLFQRSVVQMIENVHTLSQLMAPEYTGA